MIRSQAVMLPGVGPVTRHRNLKGTPLHRTLRNRRALSRVISILKLLATVVLITSALLPGIHAAPAAATPVKPNVIIFMSDDQRWDTMTAQYMPNVMSRIANGGTAFANSFVPNPLCCPSRTSTLTGLDSQHTGVWTNSGTYGGFGAFDDSSTMATDFHDAGYRTGLIGKYLNGYAPDANRTSPLAGIAGTL